jgi:hypothetical protein
VCCVLYISVFHQKHRLYFVLYIRNVILIDASKEVGVDVKTEKIKLCCRLVTRTQSKVITYY